MNKHFLPIASLLMVGLGLVLLLQAPPVQAAPDVTTNCATQTQLPQAECAALVALYNSTAGPSWNDSPGNGWNRSQTPCSWTGVECSTGTPRHVTTIDRRDGNLAGPLHNLSALSHLEYLLLIGNQLSGSIPRLSSFTRLQVLDLRRNHLSGSIPSLTPLVSLQFLALDNNELSGSIPAPLPTSLRDIGLRDNHLGGGIPDLSALTNLESIDIRDNQLSGNIPNFSSRANLQAIYLGGNRLDGGIPDLSALPLDYLYLDGNRLSGPVPRWLCDHFYDSPYFPWAVDLNYNMFPSDTVLNCLTADLSGAATQTEPPTDVTSYALSTTSFRLTWTPILYTGDGGYYEVLCGSKPGGPYTLQGTTESTGGKTASGFTVSGLPPGAHYYCVVRTFTPAHFDPKNYIYQQNDLTSTYSAEVQAPAYYDGGENRLSVSGWHLSSHSPGVRGSLNAGVLSIDVTTGPASACWYQDIDGALLRSKAMRFEAEMRKANFIDLSWPMNPYMSLQVRKGDGTWIYNYGGILNSRSSPGGPWISEARDIVLPNDMTTLRAAFCVWNAYPGTAQARYPLLRLVVTPPPPSTNLLSPEWTWAPATTGLSASRSGGTMQINVASAGAQGCWIQDLAGAPLQGQTLRFQGSMSKSGALNSSNGFVNPYVSLQVRQANGHWLYNYGGILNSRATTGGSFVTESRNITLPTDMLSLRAAFCVWNAAAGAATGKDIKLLPVVTSLEQGSSETWEEAGPETPSVLPEDSITMEEIELNERLWLPILRRGGS